MPGVIEEPAGERAAQKEERKNQHKARDALRHGPARQRPEEIANAKVFAPGQEKEASAAATSTRRQNAAAKLAWLRSMKKIRA